jgi:hypothetical protein
MSFLTYDEQETIPTNRLRELMCRAGLDEENVVKELEISPDTLNEWQSGATAIPHIALLALEALAYRARMVE